LTLPVSLIALGFARLLLTDSLAREGADYEVKSNWKECGRSFLAAAEVLPEHPRHAERLAKAAECFDRAHLVGQALKARRALIDAHPQDSLARDALFNIASGYHRLAYYSKAAELYGEFAEAYPRDPRARRACANVAEFCAALGSDYCIGADDPKRVRRPGKPPPCASGRASAGLGSHTH
jgi:TolA-binding protein